jgi:hypothetical protein
MGSDWRRYQPMVGRLPAMTVTASSSAMALVSSYVPGALRSFRPPKHEGCELPSNSCVRLVSISGASGALPSHWRHTDER